MVGDSSRLEKVSPISGKRGWKVAVIAVCFLSVCLVLLYRPIYVNNVQTFHGAGQWFNNISWTLPFSSSDAVANGSLNVVNNHLTGQNKSSGSVQILHFESTSSRNASDSISAETVISTTVGYAPSHLCSVEEYPQSFVLDTADKAKKGNNVVLKACKPEILTVRALDGFGENVNCEPWVDMYGRIVGPDLASYPRSKEYSLFFNKVEVSYTHGGNFAVHLPPLEPGEYRLEILLVHKESVRELVYSTRQKIPCLDTPLVNTPTAIVAIDKGHCAKKPKTTPLCTSGEAPGRWVTVPESGCDGALCEGDINILTSSRRVWAPYDCHYKLFNSQDFSQCFAGKKVLFIGDSITEELTNEILQIYYYTPSNPPLMKSSMVKQNKWVGRPTHWSPSLQGGSRVGFSFVMATPLGCGISCVTDKSDSQLERLLTPYGKVDLLVLLTGLHDTCPRSAPEYFDVFGTYKNKLPLFESKIRKLVAKDGRIVWINSPEGSDTSRCDYLSKPRLQRMNGLTKDFLSTRKDISLLDYFGISGSCYCGNIHKGIRFFTSSDAKKSYNGFVSRMVAHIILNSYCNSSTGT